jgi:hypothetical protein
MLVLTHLIELHAPAFEDTMILAGEHVCDQAVRHDLDAADFREDVFGDHKRDPG